ncbi:MAG: hypothetical protein V3W34_06425 [Phycisphaerae bacterium]
MPTGARIVNTRGTKAREYGGNPQSSIRQTGDINQSGDTINRGTPYLFSNQSEDTIPVFRVLPGFAY